MQIFTVSLFGHRRVHDYAEIEQQLHFLVYDLISNHEFVEFLVGRDGEFDQLAASTIRKVKRNVFDANSSLIWVQPYKKAEYNHDPKAYDDYYDVVELCDASAKAHPKAAIQLRNRSMVDRSELCIFYVEHPHGGAWETLKYAEKQNKRITLLNTTDSPFD